MLGRVFLWQLSVFLKPIHVHFDMFMPCTATTEMAGHQDPRIHILVLLSPSKRSLLASSKQHPDHIRKRCAERCTERLSATITNHTVPIVVLHRGCSWPRSRTTHCSSRAASCSASSVCGWHWFIDTAHPASLQKRLVTVYPPCWCVACMHASTYLIASSLMHRCACRGGSRGCCRPGAQQQQAADAACSKSEARAMTAAALAAP